MSSDNIIYYLPFNNYESMQVFINLMTSEAIVWQTSYTYS